MQWVLRADVERTSLLEDEVRLLHFLHGGDGSNGSSDGHTYTAGDKEGKVAKTRSGYFNFLTYVL